MNPNQDLFDDLDPPPGRPPDRDGKRANDLPGFLIVAGGYIYQGATQEVFLNWATKFGQNFLPAMAAGVADPKDVPRMFRALGVRFWNQFPQPGHHWQPQPIRRPGRNEPCWCASGDKFKHCCEPLTHAPFPHINLLRFVLNACPATRLADLARSGRPNLDAVADTAHQWCESGQVKRAVALLEPFFAEPRALTDKLEPLFDELMSALLQEGRNKRREHWIAQILARGDNALKSIALQRRATMRSDAGDSAAAWADVAQARNLNPNDPNLSMLEVTLLMGEGRLDDAAQKAKTWAAHFEKLRDPSLASLVDGLRSLAQDPSAAMLSYAARDFPELQTLVTLLAHAPAPRSMHVLGVMRGKEQDWPSHGPIAEVVADKSLQAIEKVWRTVFPQVKPDMTHLHNQAPEVWRSAAKWMAFLQREPLLLNSFDVLDDLVMAVDSLNFKSVKDKLLIPLAERAAELLRLLLESRQSPVQVPWGLMTNRPVLRPVVHLVFVCKEANKWDRFMALCHWLVRELNPADNHGLRDELSYAYARFGRSDDQLVLCHAYPDDASPTLALNEVLAHFRLGQLDVAAQKLKVAKTICPKALTMLLKPNPKAVKPDVWGVAIGGAFEAWLYVKPHQSLWQEAQALDWARGVLKKG